MAVTSAVIYRGTLDATANPGASLVTLSNNTIITSVVFCNRNTTDLTISLTLGDDKYICYDLAIGAKQTISMDISQYVASGKVIKGRASTTSLVDIHISGVTVT